MEPSTSIRPEQLMPANAPRDAAGLKAFGPMRLKMLVSKLGWGTDEQKQAWHGMSLDSQIEYTLQLLHQWDLQNPNSAPHPQPAAPAVPTSTQAPPLPPPQAANLPFAAPTMNGPGVGFPGVGSTPPFVPQVSPGAAQAAAAATADKPKRQPRTPIDPPPAAAPAVPEALMTALGHILLKITEVNDTNKKEIAELKELVAQQGQLIRHVFSLGLLQGEQALGVSQADIIGEVLERSNGLATLLSTPGKG